MSFKLQRNLLLGCAVLVVAAELFHVGLRGALTMKDESRHLFSTRLRADDQKIVKEFLISTETLGKSVLVLGNLGTAFEGDLDAEITISPLETKELEKLNSTNLSTKDETESQTLHVSIEVCSESRSGRPTPRSTPLLGQADSRIYFLQSNQGAFGVHASHSAVQCRCAFKNTIVNIYVDNRIASSSDANELVRAVAEASESGLVQIVEHLVGSVSDVDGDGRLSIVLTPDVERLGNGSTPVRGLTRYSDFAPGLDRPASNHSDVLFLSSHLRQGENLNAVMAHEWCHAAVFSRRIERCHGEPVQADEDWLNEAIAHLVEIRATGCSSNIQNRINDFMSHPESSPLVVRDYFHSEFWRHDGCRGAGFLFLQWCVQQAGDAILPKLLEEHGCTLEGLETAMGMPFPDLFQGWTRSMARSMTDNASNDKSHNQRRWRLEDGTQQTRSIRMRGASSAFIDFESRELKTFFRITVKASCPKLLQVSFVLVNETEN